LFLGLEENRITTQTGSFSATERTPTAKPNELRCYDTWGNMWEANGQGNFPGTICRRRRTFITGLAAAITAPA
jgi:hypothetical protein